MKPFISLDLWPPQKIGRKKNYGPLSNIRFLARRNPQCIKNQRKCAIFFRKKSYILIFLLKKIMTLVKKIQWQLNLNGGKKYNSG